MALRVDFNNRFGYCLVPTVNGKKTKVWLCGANCLWAQINFYRKEEDGKRVDMTQLCGFICDVAHLKRCLKNGVHLNYDGLTFFAEKMDAELWKAVKVLTENGIKVTIK